MAKVLVTGGSGYVGGYVVRQLVRRGDKVVCFDLSPVPRYLADLFDGAVPEAVQIVRGDVRDPLALGRTLKEHGVDRIAHLATLVGSTAEVDLAAGIDVNVRGTVNVFETAALADVAKVAWTSSIGVYGVRSLTAEGRIDNTSMPDPRGAYGAAKHMCERMAVLYAARRGLNVTGVRFSTVYGYGKQYTGGRLSTLAWMEQLIDRPAMGEPGEVGGADGSFDFQYVEDAARAVLAALDAPDTGGATYLTHGDQRPVQEAIDFVRELLPNAQLATADRPERMVFGGDGEGMRNVYGGRTTAPDRLYDAATTEAEIGYAPAYRMEQGVQEMIDKIRSAAGLSPTEPQES